jgi:hypothetical protein
MAFNKYSLLPLFLLASGFAWAQNPAAENFCGTTGVSPWLLWYAQHRGELVADRTSDTTELYVPVTVFLVGSDNNTGYWGTENAFRAICEMNEQFEQAHIRFYLQPGDGIRFLANSSWNDHDWSGGSDMIDANYVSDRLNAFVVSNPAGNCGYSWQDVIVLGKNCSSAGNGTWAHEAGHHFSLPHTFYGWEGSEVNWSQPAPDEINGANVERTDGSNCQNAGDFFCDTPPDYISDRWNCNAEGKSGTEQHDPAGVPFRSDGTLFMSYSNDNCMNRFSAEQIEAMRWNIQTEHESYLDNYASTDPALLVDLPDDAVVQPLSPIDTAVVQYNNVTLTWEPVPGATYYDVEVSPRPNMTPKLVNRMVSYTNTLEVPATSLPNNRLLYWRVRAFSEWDVCQPNDQAPIAVFQTANLVATNELERTAVAELSPNPVFAGAPATLFIATDDVQDAALLILDPAGRTVYRQAVRLTDGENRLALPTELLRAGVYVVALQNEKGVITKRLSIVE